LRFLSKYFNHAALPPGKLAGFSSSLYPFTTVSGLETGPGGGGGGIGGKIPYLFSANALLSAFVKS
ncbi:hypothetical protein ABTD88_19475, partial [Acinetobacter baumannii]